MYLQAIILLINETSNNCVPSPTTSLILECSMNILERYKYLLRTVVM